MRALPCLAVVIAAGLVAGCGRSFIVPHDRALLCRAEVIRQFPEPAFQPNPMSTPAGVPLGAAAGAVTALQAGYGGIFLLPFTTAIGLVGGSACAVAGAAHPSADADFQRALLAANPDILAQAIAQELDTPRACGTAGHPGAASSEVTVELLAVKAGMECLLGRHRYWVETSWRAVAGEARREIAQRVTRCEHESFRDTAAWLAHPDDARAEIEGVLAESGRYIAQAMLSAEAPANCRLHSRPDGRVERR